MSDDLRIEADYDVPNCPYCGIPNQVRRINALRKSGAVTATSEVSDPELPANTKSVYEGEVHPEYETEPCDNCKKYAEWLGHDFDYNSLHSIPKFYAGLPLDIKNMYEEAIANYEMDPVRARELLHKATRELSAYLGEKGDDLYEDLINLLSQNFTEEEIVKIVSSSKNLLSDEIETSSDPLENLHVLNELFNSFTFVAGVMNHELMHIREVMNQEKKHRLKTSINKTV